MAPPASGRRAAGRWALRTVAVAAAAAATAAAPAAAAAGRHPSFTDVIPSSGLPQGGALKYGGPLVADLDGDGTYDLVLGNHVNTPSTVHWGKPRAAAYVAGSRLLSYDEDIHGLAAGDLGGNSGGRHLLVSVGGSWQSGKPPWGLNPRAPVLLQVEGRALKTVTAPRGLAGAKMRGRAPRLVDMNGDGRLDVCLFGSKVLVPADKSPRQKVLLNGGRRFWEVQQSGLGGDTAEGLFMVDLNGDGVEDVVTFSRRLAVYIGRGGGRFKGATASWLRGIPDSLWVGTPKWSPVTTIAALDYNNDGRLDLYVGVNGSRGGVLLRNTGSRLVDVTRSAGLAGGHALTLGATVGDLNNDGWEDIIPVSHASATVPVFLNNGDGTFTRAPATGLVNTAPAGRGDGAQAYDADGDGRLDVLLSRGDRNDKPSSVLSSYRLFRNSVGKGEPGGGRYLAIAVGRSPKGGSASGARVTVTAGAGRRGGPWTRVVGGAGDVFSQSLLDTVHVGVGWVPAVGSVRVRWSDGATAVKRGVATNAKVVMP